MPRIGVFGGSFDPPHLAHTLGCLWALESGEVDRILLIPVWRHAFGKQPMASFDHRFEMCRLAVARLGNALEVSDIERRRGGVSYMIDTLTQLRADSPGATFRLIVGSDVAPEVGQWRDGARVAEMAPPLELPRPLDTRRNEGTLPDISSTAVREALRLGDSLERFLSADVREYIARHGLYRQDTNQMERKELE